jgi:hypothetical protein
MSKVARPPFSWKVLIHDFNAGCVKPYDILAYREDFIKKLKKQYNTKEEFADALERNFMWQYWSRSEYEMILYTEDNRVYLEPWCGKFKDGRVDITDNDLLDWPAFAEKMLSEYAWRDKENNRDYVKFDIYDQLMFRFEELVDFIWNYRHKYQRIKKEIENI